MCYHIRNRGDRASSFVAWKIPINEKEDFGFDHWGFITRVFELDKNF
jgi:hypothetical protein